MVFYIIYVAFGVGGLVLKNNGFSTLGQTLFVTGVIAVVLFLFALIKANINQSNFNKLIETNKSSNIIGLVLFGIPLYFLYKNFFSKKMKEDLKQIR